MLLEVEPGVTTQFDLTRFAHEIQKVRDLAIPNRSQSSNSCESADKYGTRQASLANEDPSIQPQVLQHPIRFATTLRHSEPGRQFNGTAR